MNRKFKPLILFTLAVCGSAILNSCTSCCKSNESDPWSSFNCYQTSKIASDVDKYFDATLGYNAESSNTFDVYTEMSMDFGYMAYKMPYNKSFAGDIFFEMNKIHHYKIEKDGVVDNGILIGKDAILAKINDPSVYKSSGVDIEKGLNELVKKNKPALLITDFELWDETNANENLEAVYNPSFKKWLSKPNHSITFYYANFCDANTDKAGRVGEGKKIMPDRFYKKIFFAFFDTDRNKTFSKNALPVSVPKEFSKIIVDIAPYKVSTHYSSVEKSGLAMPNLVKSVKSGGDVKQGLLKDKSYEFIRSNYNWERISEIINKSKSDPILNNLSIDASDNAAFDLNNISVNVTDVTKDFEYFVKCNHAKTLKPKFKTDKNGNDVFDPSSDNISKSVYDPKSKKIKAKWVYKPNNNLQEIKELFTINDQLFKNSKSKSLKNIKVETKIHPSFRLDKIKNRHGLLRIDIVAKDVKRNYSSFEKLTWDSPSNTGGAIKYKNSSLTKSINSALKSLNAGQIIYSYYIKTNDDNKK